MTKDQAGRPRVATTTDSANDRRTPGRPHQAGRAPSRLRPPRKRVAAPTAPLPGDLSTTPAFAAAGPPREALAG